MRAAEESAGVAVYRPIVEESSNDVASA